MNVEWHKIWPNNEKYGTNCDNLDMLIKEISKIAEVGLDSVNPVGITEVLESHSQPLCSEELYDLAQQLTEQHKEDEDEEDRGTKEMQMKDLTDIISAIDMAACGLDWVGPGQGQVADACEYGNGPSGSMKCGEFLD